IFNGEIHSFIKRLFRYNLSDIKFCSAGHISPDKQEMENERRGEEAGTIRTVDVPNGDIIGMPGCSMSGLF
uniref:Uncharacterized protein n=1 Tax=Cyprinus carpio TaxID=7962 RepID=A0A8C2E6C0_CYPCA